MPRRWFTEEQVEALMGAGGHRFLSRGWRWAVLVAVILGLLSTVTAVVLAVVVSHTVDENRASIAATHDLSCRIGAFLVGTPIERTPGESAHTFHHTLHKAIGFLTALEHQDCSRVKGAQISEGQIEQSVRRFRRALPGPQASAAPGQGSAPGAAGASSPAAATPPGAQAGGGPPAANPGPPPGGGSQPPPTTPPPTTTTPPPTTTTPPPTTTVPVPPPIPSVCLHPPLPPKCLRLGLGPGLESALTALYDPRPRGGR